MRKEIKYIMGNTLFFGFIGSWVGGAIFLFLLATFGARPFSFSEYLILSPVMGFIPASLTGFLFILELKRHIPRFKQDPFWLELFLASKNAFYILAMIWLLLNSSNQINKENLVGFAALIFIGVTSAIICANMMTEWNRKLIP